MNQKNTEHAAKLRQLAEVYRAAEGELPASSLVIYVDSKAELMAVMHAVGGKFIKKMGEDFMSLLSERIPGLTVDIWRDKVCERIVSYKCEPLLSPAEEAEVLTAADPS